MSEQWEIGKRTGQHDIDCVTSIGPIAADHCHWCGPILTISPDEADNLVAKLALFDRMREVLQEVQRAYPAAEGNIGLIALDYQMKFVDKVLAEADALERRRRNDTRRTGAPDASGR